jgi:DNA (cytosine-5)-methyltransferase 1
VEAAIGDLIDAGRYACVSADHYGEQLHFAARMRFDQSLRPPAQPDTDNLRPPNHVERRHRATTLRRFSLLLLLRDLGLPYSLLSHPQGRVRPASAAISELLSALPVGAGPWTLSDGHEVADKRALATLLVSARSRKRSQRPLDAMRPAPTMLSLPDDHVHYAKPRTLTVREVARIQSFPDTFEFYGKETTGGLARRSETPQYTQVANAVPPQVAYVLGTKLRDLLL